MNKKHLLTISGILLIGIFIFTACNSHNSFRPHMHTRSSRGVAEASGGGGTVSLGMGGSRWTLESTVEIATDVVVAEFVGRRPFGQRTTEYEFIVHDRIFGNAADTIFVYVVYDEMSHRFVDPDLQFTTGTQYLLTLIKLADIYTSFHYDAFIFINDLMLDLNDPSGSTMYNQPLSLFSDMNFDSNGLTKEHIISYVRTLPRNPHLTVDRVFITTDNLWDIINGSPYVLIIEITEPIRMASEALHSDIRSTDIYYTTVVEVLKGDLQVGDVVTVTFFADTVFLGETHIVSIAPLSGSSCYQIFTSSHSLHSMEQRNEIISIIRGPRDSSDPIDDPIHSPPPASIPSQQPASTPSPTSTPEVVEDETSSRFTASLYEPGETANIKLINIEIDLPEDFTTEVLLRDDLNAMFLQEEMHSIAVLVDDDAADDILSIISVYVGDLELSDLQMLMLRGFVIDPETGVYTIIPGTFSADRSHFNFEFLGSGIIGAMFYELPTPLLRLTINQYRYYYRGSPLTSDAAPFITQNRTMVPIRLVSEALDATPRWDRPTRTAYIYYNDTVLRLPVGYPLPDGMGSPELRNNRVLVPLRFVIENFGAVTLWDSGLREVTVFILPLS